MRRSSASISGEMEGGSSLIAPSARLDGSVLLLEGKRRAPREEGVPCRAPSLPSPPEPGEGKARGPREEGSEDCSRASRPRCAIHDSNARPGLGYPLPRGGRRGGWRAAGDAPGV